jgi:hypothetical protein
MQQNNQLKFNFSSFRKLELDERVIKALHAEKLFTATLIQGKRKKISLFFFYLKITMNFLFILL